MKNIGWLNIATILMIGLKLAGVLYLSWWWVFSPTLISFCLAIVAVLVISALATAIEESAKGKR